MIYAENILICISIPVLIACIFIERGARNYEDNAVFVIYVHV